MGQPKGCVTVEFTLFLLFSRETDGRIRKKVRNGERERERQTEGEIKE